MANDITYKQVEDFCKKRNLAMVPYETMQALRLGFCDGAPEQFEYEIKTTYQARNRKLENKNALLVANVQNLETEVGRLRFRYDNMKQLLNQFIATGLMPGYFDIYEKLKVTEIKLKEARKKEAAAKSNEAYWRDRKEEEEDYHYYWFHTFDRAVKKAAEKGIHIGVRGNDDECNAGIVTLDNMKAEKLESKVAQMEDTNKKLNQQVLHLEDDYQKLKEKLGAADNALEYWNNTYNDIVIAGKKVGVKIDIKGKKPDDNVGFVYVTNKNALDLAYKLNDAKQEHDKKWSAMTEALKDKGVEVIYMGEEDGKPIVDVKIPKLDALQRESDARGRHIDVLWKDYVVRGRTILDLKKEIKNLKSQKVATCTLAAGADGELKFIYTYMDGHNEATPINDTLPTCKSCAHYVSGSRSADLLCHIPVSKEGPGTIRKLSKEEAEGPACSDFKAKE